MKITIQSIDQNKLESMGVFNWAIWECEESEFSWFYPEKESCYLLEGEVQVITDFETVSFGKGDYVVFPKGLSCSWKVLKPVRKHYTMD